MFVKIDQGKYEYTIRDEDIEALKVFMTSITIHTKNRKLYAPVKNLTLEYTAIENLIVDRFVNMYDVNDPVIITVNGKYAMEIYLVKSKELSGITYSSEIL